MIFLELSVVGGDLRIVKLIEMLAKEKFLIYTYAIENADVLKEYEEVIELSSLNELQNSTEIIISASCLTLLKYSLFNIKLGIVFIIISYCPKVSFNSFK